MNFVFQKEKSEVDAWVAGLDEAAMEQAIGEAAAAMKVGAFPAVPLFFNSQRLPFFFVLEKAS